MIATKFVAIVDENARLSGENDSTWQARYHHKWHGVKAVRPGRHVRTAEDLKEPNELFRDDTISRPPASQGLARVKYPIRLDRRDHLQREKVPKFSGKWSKKGCGLNVKKMDFIETQKKFEELKFLNFSTDGMRPEDAAKVERLKDEIRAKHFPPLQHAASP
ncbi:hypothetical protein Tco_1114171 [Tanacetum coccineum]|uniref:Uncharacterized protein n=1 Tax=Tanacetum coccineum TaxID=301880 RepID=A0ABQ5IUB4_9ASTR